MTPKIKNILDTAGIVAGVVTEDDLERLVKIVAIACAKECRRVSYDAMSITLDLGSPLLEFERGSKSGRKLAALDCAQQLANTFDVSII